MSLTLSEHDLSLLKHNPGGIYAISRVGDYRCYIGSAVNVRGRIRAHVSDLKKVKHHSRRLQRAVAKHGAESFEVFLIEVVPNKEDLIKREQFWIDLHNAARVHGYNCSPTAGSTRGVIPNETTREKLRTAFKGKTHSEEARAKMSAARRGESNPMKRPEVAAKNAAARAGKKFSEEHRANLSGAHRGKKQTVETVAKRAAANRGKKRSEEFCQAVRARTHSPETRSKLSALRTGERNPNFGKKLSPESIAKRESTKRANKERKRREMIFANLAVIVPLTT